MSYTMLIGISEIANHSDSCLCWLMVLLDIFAMLYLTFITIYKITKFTRFGAIIVSGGNIIFSIFILAFHTCIYTLCTIIFSSLISILLFGIAISNINNLKNSKKASKGCYVIHHVDETHFCFGLYSNNNKMLCKSKYCYNSIEDVKSAIKLCITCSKEVQIQNQLNAWVKDVNHPLLRLYMKENNYFIDLHIRTNYVIIESEGFKEYHDLLSKLSKIQKCLQSEDVYFDSQKTVTYSEIVIDEYINNTSV